LAALRRVLIGLFVFVAILVAVGVAEAAHESTRKHCVSSDRYGASCLELYGTGLTADDIIGSYQQPASGYLDNATWRQVLTTYRCDPRGVAKERCAPASTHLDRVRVGAPPAGGAYAYVSHGDFGLSTPWKLSQPQWICAEITRREGGRWVDNGGPNGLRACAQVRA
jgi:hypothetical protein